MSAFHGGRRRRSYAAWVGRFDLSSHKRREYLDRSTHGNPISDMQRFMLEELHLEGLIGDLEDEAHAWEVIGKRAFDMMCWGDLDWEDPTPHRGGATG